ncbi:MULTISPECIES: sulfite exporter TauE/SafE family protein [Terrisporobacter]|uniref:Probable membrane transporter protein n=2 Tax=Terrisporobacter TaxID=1505652 RepID=A0A0B3VWY8_9FIRM|nr:MULTISPECIES: sulfite exporter TauE/SafE family protein [Terrisporobacter]KHS57119.1 permease [Terrisporobacter othiniensis]MCC3671279.1 sulfite exporter TauE/SafE family protein [Terrisporobacter mayombei]MCR1824122.1 sulfite exporter TauE/SafE family protein [Terrisporobacter muris]MDU6984007.1 sulfite exporter TauE/SafE family protein [Terrisporobacter othiniensis]
MLLALRGILLSLMGVYYYTFFKDYRQVKEAGELDNTSVVKVGALGWVANFFDTLGIGSFAIIVAANKFFKIGIKDKELPGFLNVGCCLPVMCEAFIFTTVIEVDPVTLFSMLIAAAVGSYVGAGIISKMDEAKIQLVMGLALLATAVLMFCSKMGYMPGGGDAIGLSGAKLAIGVVGNAILGALMTAGVGLFAPCMALTYFLGLSPQVTFPIMMGSCAMLQPVSSVKFIKEGAYPRKASLVLSLCGAVGVFVAAFIVKSLPIETLKWVVMAVLVYTGASMIAGAMKNLGKEAKVVAE